MKEKKNNYFVFDVESDGLYGEGFCFSAVVFSSLGTIQDSLTLKADIEIETKWVKENVLPALKFIKSAPDTKTLRSCFYDFYMKHKDRCNIYSDVNYPVETNFLNAVAMDDLGERQWNMPYPLMDISNIIPVSLDREQYYIEKNAYWIVCDVPSRKPKKHHPYWDCLCSAYALIKNGCIEDNSI